MSAPVTVVGRQYGAAAGGAAGAAGGPVGAAGARFIATAAEAALREATSCAPNREFYVALARENKSTLMLFMKALSKII